MPSDSNEFQTLQLLQCTYLTECQMTENINKEVESFPRTV